MKKLFKNTSSLFLLLTFMASTQASVMTVKKMKGKAFINYNGKMRSLKVGEQVHSGAELSTESSAVISLFDFHNRKVVLSGGSDIKVSEHLIDLKRGYLKVSTKLKTQVPLIITSPNAIVQLESGESIVSFDGASEKTQAMSLSGYSLIASKIEPKWAQEIKEGSFSIVKKDLHDGLPRVNSVVTNSTLKKISSLFYIESVKNRSIASVSLSEEPRKLKKTAEDDLFEKGLSGKLGKQKDPLMSHYLTKLNSMVKPKKVFKVKYKKESQVSVRIFGKEIKSDKKVKPVSRVVKSKKVVRNRVPASISPKVMTKVDAFEKSLQKEYKAQKKHPEEVNSLINELKSFKMNYEESF